MGMSPSTANPTLLHGAWFAGGDEKWPHPKARPVQQGEEQDRHPELASPLCQQKVKNVFSPPSNLTGPHHGLFV
jgi:hypothetical protein